jgi:hypothetical protein
LSAGHGEGGEARIFISVSWTHAERACLKEEQNPPEQEIVSLPSLKFEASSVDRYYGARTSTLRYLITTMSLPHSKSSPSLNQYQGLGLQFQADRMISEVFRRAALANSVLD